MNMTKSFQHPVVLMYHGIVSEWTALPQERETGAELYDVTSVAFQEQMQWLRDHRYAVTTSVGNGGGPSASGKNVVLTFDDGEMNNYDQAFPVLRKHGFPAYFFIIAKRVGRQGYMGWDELRELHQAGMTIGSHGFSHEILTDLLDTQIEEELRASKRYLERNLDIRVDSLSIPRGFCDDKVIRMAYDAGYTRIFVSDRPKDLRLDCFGRVAVKGHWPLKRFQQTLDGNIPIHERIRGRGKNAAKRILGGGVYDWVRKAILKIRL